MDNVRERMQELMIPIDKSIMMCDNGDELLMIACAMLSSAKTILTQQLGQKGMMELINASLNGNTKLN